MMDLVVIPTYNERENIERLLEKILALSHPFHILVVDDSSPDGTWKVVERISREESRVKLLIRKKKEGLGKAYQEAYLHALREGYEFFLQMDCDFSHPPEYLPLLREEGEKFSLVIGSRYVKGGRTEGWSRGRKFISRLGNIYAGICLGLPVRDATSGFRCYQREVLESIPLRNISGRGFYFQIEMTYWTHRLGFSIKEVPIVFRERERGKSKMHPGIVVEALIQVPCLRWRRIRD